MEKVIVYTDGGARGNPGNAGIGVFITDEKENVLKKVAKPIGIATNNFAEYEAIIVALTELKDLYFEKTKEMEFEFRVDSELVQRQLTGKYRVKDKGLKEQFTRVSELIEKYFPNVEFNHIPREENSVADGLANEAMDESE